jgi:hypothetical protein
MNVANRSRRPRCWPCSLVAHIRHQVFQRDRNCHLTGDDTFVPAGSRIVEMHFLLKDVQAGKPTAGGAERDRYRKNGRCRSGGHGSVAVKWVNPVKRA